MTNPRELLKGIAFIFMGLFALGLAILFSVGLGVAILTVINGIKS